MSSANVCILWCKFAHFLFLPIFNNCIHIPMHFSLQLFSYTHTHINTQGRCKVIININYFKYPSSLIVVLFFLVASFCYFLNLFFSEKLRIFFVFFNVNCVLLQNFPTFAKCFFAKINKSIKLCSDLYVHQCQKEGNMLVTYPDY